MDGIPSGLAPHGKGIGVNLKARNKTRLRRLAVWPKWMLFYFLVFLCRLGQLE